ncbi:MAG: toll/interleukin-1 receptor domain-containing protein [Verrucomicrobia bacterium]|nr:toll/interleukin-1 receptor domain-containing protein [Verrucomicrobiota bacterium]
MRHAFVSHSTADDSFIAEMESFLRAAGFDDVFNDVHAIKPDEQFWPRIEQGITDCDTFIVVITAAAANSEWVKREVALARRLGKRVIPVWREDCPLPPDFSDRDVIDFRPRTRKERRIDIDRIVKYAPGELIGREDETKLLMDAWQKALRLEKGRAHVLTFVALGGEGKTSLVAKWAAELAAQDWPGCDAAFAWSFYSQGTREQLAASSDLFLKAAITFFGDDADQAFAASPAGAFEKGQRLARLVGQRRNLLILDGLEPLQYAPSAPTPGELKDQGVAALLKGLAATSHGLCVVTTRYSLPDLRAFWPAHPSPSGRGAGGEGTACEVKLLRLSRDAGVHLLKTLGVTGTAQEFATLVEDVKGHALTLTLLGGFLKRAFHGDIRQRDRVKFEKADEKMDGGHAFRTMAAYEQWLLRDGGDEGRREMAVLWLMGLFDRPADAGCLAALRSETIPGLTEPLAGMADDDWEYCLTGLEAAKLLTVNRDTSGTLVSLDAHPHLREYFARQLRTQQPDAWRVAHRRLYEHLCATTKEGDQPTLEDLQPLYQAVVHGCQAGLQQETCERIYVDRINRGMGSDGFYSTRRLGAFGSDLGAAACFFELPWTDVSPAFNAPAQTWLLNAVAFFLRALGRPSEAREPTRVSREMCVQQEDWGEAALRANNLSQLELILGEVAAAVGDAQQSVTYADRSGDAFDRWSRRVTHGDALHQAGRRNDAKVRFLEAEQILAESHPNYPIFSSPANFNFCGLLLAEAERDAWGGTLNLNCQLRPSEGVEVCRVAKDRAHKTLGWDGIAFPASILGPALDHLTLGRIALCGVIMEESEVRDANSEVEQAIDGLRRAGVQEYLIQGLLTRAWLRFLTGDCTGPESAQADLEEAWEIAERGPMRLFMADIHLHRARLFFREKVYPWESPAADLAAAEKLIIECSYHRRDEELADAKHAIFGT